MWTSQRPAVGSSDWLDRRRLYGIFRPSLAQVNEVNDPCHRIAAEDGECDPSPAVTAREKPSGNAINRATSYHSDDARLEVESQRDPANE